MSDVIAELLKVADEQDSIELKIFKNAVIKTLNEYQESPTKANKNNMDAARENLKQKKEEMVTKYLTPPEDGGAVASFPSLLQVLEHLKNSGFRISKSKLYRDRDKGLILVNRDGSVLESEVRAYAGINLERVAGNIDDMNDIQAQKAKADVELRHEQILKIRQTREVEEGKYLLRQDFEAELASRAVVLDSGLRHMVQMRVAEWVALVGGKPGLVPDLIQDMNRELDGMMNNYATLENFQVIFQKGKE